jgi:hypothetical protein
MPYKVTTTTIIPAETPKFDEWFDTLPIDYFKDTPIADGKNKFELLETQLSPAEIRQVDNAIQVDIPYPISDTTTKETNENGDLIITGIKIWADEISYKKYQVLYWGIYTDQEYLDWSLSALPYLDPTDDDGINVVDGIVTFTAEKISRMNEQLPEELKRNNHIGIWLRYMNLDKTNFLTNTYNTTYSITPTITYEEI